MAWLEKNPEIREEKIKDQVDHFIFPDGKKIIILARGRLVNLDGEVAQLHLAKVGAKLTKLSPDQAEYLGISVQGPFKPDAYRY